VKAWHGKQEEEEGKHGTNLRKIKRMHSMRLEAKTLNLLKDGIILHLGRVCSLYFDTHAIQCTTDSILARSGHHLALDLGRVWSPEDKDKLRTHTVTAFFVLDIVDCVAALVFWQFGGEILPVAAVGFMLNDNLGVGAVECVDDIAKRFA
jgi:hypothetical protein